MTQRISFTGADAFQAYMGTMENTSSMVTAISQTVGLRPEDKMSINEDFFSRIYDIAYGEKANKDMEQDNKKELAIKQKEKEENAEQARDGMTASIESFKEYQKELQNIEGYDFTHTDLEEALGDIINDKEAFQAKHGLTDEEADRAIDHAIIMQGMTREERENYLRELEETDPDVAKAIKAEAKDNHAENELKNSGPTKDDVSTSEQATHDNKLNDLDAMLAEMKSSPFADTVIAETQTSIENAEHKLSGGVKNIDITQETEQRSVSASYDHTKALPSMDM